MVRLMFRHLTGARAPHVDNIVLESQTEILLGRAPSADIRFDPLEDRRVGRLHARISWTDDDPISFMLTDLGSRNGTFVNGRLLTATIDLHSGDVIQLGALGPEVEVKWEGAGSSKLLLIG
jgi:pSer/pThr/pTyr-binding forkhead associated (FHA) protein